MLVDVWAEHRAHLPGWASVVGLVVPLDLEDGNTSVTQAQTRAAVIEEYTPRSRNVPTD